MFLATSSFTGRPFALDIWHMQYLHFPALAWREIQFIYLWTPYRIKYIHIKIIRESFALNRDIFCGFNSILNNRLDKFLVENKIIDDCQIGFTKKTRTCDHMFNLKCIFDKYCKEKNGELYVCFVEFHKAFDTI